MKRNIVTVVVILCLVLIWSTPVFAENGNPFKISTLDVSIMPEYDTSDVLVIYSINFINTSGQPFSGEMRFPVPKGTTNNVIEESGILNGNNLLSRIDDKGDYAELIWKPAKPIQPNVNYTMHLEYYYNPLQGTGNKAFTFPFRATLPIDQANINAYQPLKANNFKMEPAGKLLGQDNQGFQVYGTKYSNLKNGDKIDFKISYTKNDPNPSVQKQSGAAPASDQQAPSAGSQLNFGVMVLIAALIVVVIVIGVKIFDNRKSSIKNNSRDNKKQGAGNSKLAQEKRKLRQMLLNGTIGEDTYHEMLMEIEEEYS